MSQTKEQPFSRLNSLVLAVAPVVAASTLGSLATLPNIPGWYASIAKPWFNPPNWIFGPVWTLLFAMMAYAFFRVLRLSDVKGHLWPMTAFFVQLALNAGWSAAFFGGHSPLLGLIVIVPLWAAILWTIILFWRRDTIAGALLVPYLAWVSFAAVLNGAIWRLNG